MCHDGTDNTSVVSLTCTVNTTCWREKHKNKTQISIYIYRYDGSNKNHVTKNWKLQVHIRSTQLGRNVVAHYHPIFKGTRWWSNAYRKSLKVLQLAEVVSRTWPEKLDTMGIPKDRSLLQSLTTWKQASWKSRKSKATHPWLPGVINHHQIQSPIDAEGPASGTWLRKAIGAGKIHQPHMIRARLIGPFPKGAIWGSWQKHLGDFGLGAIDGKIHQNSAILQSSHFMMNHVFNFWAHPSQAVQMWIEHDSASNRAAGKLCIHTQTSHELRRKKPSVKRIRVK